MSDRPEKPLQANTYLPPRMRWLSLPIYFVFLLLIVSFYMSLAEVEFSFQKLVETGIPSMWENFWEMSPVDWTKSDEPVEFMGYAFHLYSPYLALTENEYSRMDSLCWTMLLTIQIAFVGGTLGIIVSFVFSFFIARNTTPHPVISMVLRSVVTFCRTVPDLVWAVFFVIAVGLGPIAGVLAIMMDTIGYCGRFFSDDLEGVDPGPQDALRSLGAGRIGTFCVATVPPALPSMFNNGMFAYEKAIRSSMILGIVGAGGIGIELKAAMDMFEYRLVGVIVILIFIVVLTFEKFTNVLTDYIRGQEPWGVQMVGKIINKFKSQTTHTQLQVTK